MYMFLILLGGHWDPYTGAREGERKVLLCAILLVFGSGKSEFLVEILIGVIVYFSFLLSEGLKKEDRKISCV